MLWRKNVLITLNFKMIKTIYFKRYKSYEPLKTLISGIRSDELY